LSHKLYAITGITGRVGGATAQALLAKNVNIRAIVRDRAKAAFWTAQGAEAAVADFQDVAALAAAFTGVDGVFVMIPPYFAPAENFPEARVIIATLCRALETARPSKVVCLSSIGAHLPEGIGLITQLHIMEREMCRLPMPMAFLRAAWFMENSRQDIPTARATGEILSFLQPLDRAISMVATVDIGRVAAQTLQETWRGQRFIEIEGPCPYAPNDIAAVLASMLGRPVQAVAVPPEQWRTALGSPANAAHIEMLEGFNSGWIDFQRGTGTEHITGMVTMKAALQAAAPY
jgi:NAD(P)H dehydrogenase (quinone)